MVGDQTVAIQEKDSPAVVGQAIASLARDQHGVVSAAQLRSLGLSWEAIRWRVKTGRLHRLYRGVYAAGHDRLTWSGRYMATVLACGPDAAASHRSAADILCLRSNRTRFEVTVPRSRKGPAGITVYRSRLMEYTDFAVVNGIRVTSPSRTLLDLAAVLDRPALEHVIDKAERAGQFDGFVIQELLERSAGHPGAGRLKGAIAEYKPLETRGVLEEEFQLLMRNPTVPNPQVNVSVMGQREPHEVDCFWPDHRLVVQLDGFEYHRTRRDRERDASIDADLELAGYRVLRLTWNDVIVNRGRTLARLRLYIGGGPPPGGPPSG